jgi:hypothetical protein
MPEKKQTSKSLHIAHSITCGAILAEIRTHQSNAGFDYYSFKLERIYAASTGKQVRGSEFFGKNAQDIAQAAHEAAEWISAQQQANP